MKDAQSKRQKITPFPPRHGSKKPNDRQRLVDLLFDVAMKAHSDERLQSLTQEEFGTWVARQLETAGFPTRPAGTSWGVLTKSQTGG